MFHSGEVNSFERHYIAGEPGIAPFDSPTSPTLSPLFYPPPPSSSHRFTHAHPALPPHALPPLHHYQPAQPHGTVLASTSASDSPRSEYLPTPPLELAELSSSSDSFPFPTFPPSQTSQLYTQYTQAQSQPYFSPQPPPHTQPYPHSHAHAHSPFPIPYSDQKEPLPQQRLRDGDVLYWHYLSRGGEIPEVEEDCRAKNRARGGRARMLFDR